MKQVSLDDSTVQGLISTITDGDPLRPCADAYATRINAAVTDALGCGKCAEAARRKARGEAADRFRECIQALPGDAKTALKTRLGATQVVLRLRRGGSILQVKF